MKASIKLALFTIVFMISFTVLLTSAYLVDTGEINPEVQVGHVKVDYHIYFDDGITQADASESLAGTYDGVNYFKTGIYTINISDPNALNYIENLRIDFYVSSNVDTYFRITLEEQLAMTRVDEQGVTTEYTYIADNSILNFNVADWSFNPLLNKKYWYYKTPVKQIGEDPLLISFVLPYFSEQNYVPKSGSYSIQMAIRIDAVQAISGPQYNWDLPNKPWGGSWS